MKKMSAFLHEIPQLKGPRVLVVDDEALTRRAVARWLGGLGFEVVSVATAAEALTLLAAEAFDVVVADLLLTPPERGDRLLAEVRDLYPRMRRVLFSGQPIEDPSVAHFFVAKPASVESLEQAVRSPGPGDLSALLERGWSN